MSNARFSILQARAVKDKRISDAQFRTLAALGMYADEDGWCFPMLSTLGTDLGKSKQAVGRDTIALRKLGYLEVQARYDKNGSRRSSLYRLKYDLPRQPDVDTPSTGLIDTPSTPEVDVNDTKNDPNLTRVFFDEEKADIGWAMKAGKKVTEKQLFKLSETKAFDDMLDEQFRRLRLNFSAFDEKAKEAFRRFIRLQPKDQTLERFVSWWLEDEWRAANPPYTLGVIMQRWLQAFTNHTDETRGEYKTDSDGLPETY